jgi:GDP-L-fucose synthase
MEKQSRIYVAGHRGLAGSAIMRKLKSSGYQNLIGRSHEELDLTEQNTTRRFFEKQQPAYVFLAAAVVGGIQANSRYPAKFIRDNLAIQTNVMHEAWRCGVKRLLFLGSSCIYPKMAPQPLEEKYLLSDYLEPTNRPYAIAKIAGIEMCWSYNRQHNARFLAAMPTNLYGPGDNYDLETSHVLPALIRKFHEAKNNRDSRVTVWGSGKPRREFLHSDDMAAACVYLMNLPNAEFQSLLGGDDTETGLYDPPVVNIGTGKDLTIKELAELIRDIVGFDGDIVFDPSRPDGTPRKLLDNSKLTEIGWQRTISLPEGLKSVYADFVASYQRSDE